MNANQQPKSANFNFLAKRYPDLERMGALCEYYFTSDPIVALIHLRQFGELLAQVVAARSGLLTDARDQQADLLRRLRIEANYPPNVLDLFHQIRINGNAATHRRDGDHAKALACLKMARQLGIWFYRTSMIATLSPAHFSRHDLQLIQLQTLPPNLTGLKLRGTRRLQRFSEPRK
jgi:type I restriction enzyme R subunit